MSILCRSRPVITASSTVIMKVFLFYGALIIIKAIAAGFMIGNADILTAALGAVFKSN